MAEKDNDVEFGLIGNKKLLFSTSVFKKHLGKPADAKFAFTGEEFLTDPISMMMLAEGMRNKVIDWPKDSFKETGYHMVLFTKPKPKPKKEDDDDDKKDAKKDDKKDDKKKKDDDEEVEMSEPKIEVKFVGTNWPAALKTFETATKDDASTGIVLHSNLNW